MDKVVIMDNLSKAYIALKEGFPNEYVVDLPMDPYLPQFLDAYRVSLFSSDKRTGLEVRQKRKVAVLRERKRRRGNKLQCTSVGDVPRFVSHLDQHFVVPF